MPCPRRSGLEMAKFGFVLFFVVFGGGCGVGGCVCGGCGGVYYLSSIRPLSFKAFLRMVGCFVVNWGGAVTLPRPVSDRRSSE